MALFKDVQEAVGKAKTESGELGAVKRVLERAGYRKAPHVSQTTATTPDGRPAGVARVYLFAGTPDGDIVLVAGPSIEGRVVRPVTGGIEGIPKGTVLMQAPGITPGREKSLTKRYAERPPRTAPARGPKRVRVAPPPAPKPWEPITPVPLPEARRRRRGPEPQDGQWIPASGPPKSEPTDAQRMALFEQLLQKALATV